MQPIKQFETRVTRTYRGGVLLDRFFGKPNPEDCFKPEDWISSFTQAKNRVYVENEGITRVLVDGEERLLTEFSGEEFFGKGRTQAGVLIKLIDSAERLGIQVHPDKDFAQRFFGSPYGKTESWHILDTRDDNASVYIGFKKGVTKEIWKNLFDTQDIQGMLDALHCFKVKKGDTIMVKAGVPHAIGAGCFLMEVQEPTDYTMKVEKTTLAGQQLTDIQLHYGIGVDNMMDCFCFEGLTEEEAREKFFLCADCKPDELVNVIKYTDTECFRMDKVCGGSHIIRSDCFYTIVVTDGEGSISHCGNVQSIKKGDKLIVPASCTEVEIQGVEACICYPPAI